MSMKEGDFLNLKNATPGVSAPATRPQAPDMDAIQAEMTAWLHRGGKIAPGTPPIGGELHLPGGTFGGEFSPDEIAAYEDAQRKLQTLRRLQDMRSRVQGRDQDFPAPTTVPDATVVKKSGGYPNG